VPVKANSIAEFNVPGHKPDNPGKARLAIDGDPNTMWPSDNYYPAVSRSSSPASA